MPSANCRLGLLCLWRWSLKLQLPLFYFCPIGEGPGSAGRAATSLSRSLHSSTARRPLVLAKREQGNHTQTHPCAHLRYWKKEHSLLQRTQVPFPAHAHTRRLTTTCNSSSNESNALFCTRWTSGQACGTQTYIQACAHTHKIKGNNILKPSLIEVGHFY